ncbi:MAG: hypothetical protein ACRDNS_27970, partial [Trebonia sp.]
STIVIAQTSNEPLDELNARAQAIRKQHRELGDDGLDIPGRPYQLHAGDHIQVRHTITHPDHGPLRNGTAATLSSIDRSSGELALELPDGDEVTLDREQIEQADLRLAYVQHPFPAQGHTTDTTHLIIAGQATREGTYVAITRARHATDIYATPTDQDSPGDADRLAQLADRVSRTEPEVPSISTPLAHENNLTQRTELYATAALTAQATREEITHQPLDTPARHVERGAQPTGEDMRTVALGLEDSGDQTPGKDPPKPTLDKDDRRITSPQKRTEYEPEHALQRVWPGRDAPERDAPGWDADQPEREPTIGWEL